MDVIREFFAAWPAVLRALWEFGDPRGLGNGWIGVAITVGSVVLLVAFLAAAKATYGKHEWVSATFGMMGGTIAMWWVFGILPSAWVYFVDGSGDLIAGRIIPQALPGFDNFYEVFRDSVVAAETTVGVIGLAVVVKYIQTKYPRGLAPGEEKSPATGGYK